MRVAVCHSAPLRRGATANERGLWPSMRKPANEVVLLYWTGQRVMMKGRRVLHYTVCMFVCAWFLLQAWCCSDRRSHPYPLWIDLHHVCCAWHLCVTACVWRRVSTRETLTIRRPHCPRLTAVRTTARSQVSVLRVKVTDVDLGECTSGSDVGIISLHVWFYWNKQMDSPSDRATANFHPHMLATLDHWCGLPLKCTDSLEYRRPAPFLFV
jgi:hypothetical protein